MIKEQYLLLHSNCPKCNSSKIKTSNKKVKCNDEDYEDVVNSASCEDCKWKGMVKNLVPSKELQAESQMESTIATGSTVQGDEYHIWLEYAETSKAIKASLQKTIELVQYDTTGFDAIAKGLNVESIPELSDPKTALSLLTQLITVIQNSPDFATAEPVDEKDKEIKELKILINNAAYVIAALSLRATSPAKTVAVIRDMICNLIDVPAQQQYDRDIESGKITGTADDTTATTAE